MPSSEHKNDREQDNRRREKSHGEGDDGRRESRRKDLNEKERDQSDEDEDERRERKEKRRRSSRRGREDKDRRRPKKRDHRSDTDEDDDDDDSNSPDEDRKSRHRRKKHRSSSRHKKKSSSRKRKRGKKRRRRSSSSESESDPSSDSDSSSDDYVSSKEKVSTVLNKKLLAKLNARGETLEERKERRAQKRAAKIQARFGYTAEENPFNDPNLHETFTWTKKKEKNPNSNKENPDTLQEIDSIRQRRKDREAERDEMERLRAEEARMKELENYDEWARKEEEFHLEQQRKRSAIRLVEGREKPVDILAKNLLLFGLSDEEKKHRAAIKYQERYNALDQLDKLGAELEEPHKIVKVLKLLEIRELLVDINAFRMLEKESMGSSDSKSTILLYWDALHIVAQDEMKLLQNGGKASAYAKKVESIKEIFVDQSRASLTKMRDEIKTKLAKNDGQTDCVYWYQVNEQLTVHMAKMDLSDLHSKMLVRQLERLEQRKAELARNREKSKGNNEGKDDEGSQPSIPQNVEPGFGNREDELGASDEVVTTKKYSWQDRYAPRKPRYFNRVKTGYDWNKYNQTHYDHDNPPPKTVQGYKFNIFYPDLVDPTITPQFFIEPADTNDFCILRFHAGAPYEDVAFKIINREWNRSRKRGFKCTFERGVLSVYFNFTTHWYRR